MRFMLKSKIHGLTVTDTNLHYCGSISLDPELMKKADIVEYEQVHVLSVSGGGRLITYAIPGEKGEVVINGAAAHLINKGEEIMILTYALTEARASPRIVRCN